jgi:hypothetical protein
MIESRHTHDFASCTCGNIAVDGGLSYERLSGRGLEDASYEPLHIYRDGQRAAGRQFIPFLDGQVWWGGGDGWALDRLLAALMSGTLPEPKLLSVAGQRRLGYLAEVVLAMSPERGPEKKLRELIADLRDRLHLEPVVGDALDQLWLPSQVAGADEKAIEWGLVVGFSERLRLVLRTKVD